MGFLAMAHLLVAVSIVVLVLFLPEPEVLQGPPGGH